MDIKTEKLKVIEKLLKTQDKAILDQVKAVLGENDPNRWDNLPEHVQQSIKRSEEQINNGQVRPHKVVMAEIKKKFLK